mmetsp:Transcript_12385/g.39482  ORF Transcript_12385/g.39482 Transcript_12385/m.39482 type:complete len:463 (+) Transcript_12385:96-1484(+)
MQVPGGEDRGGDPVVCGVTTVEVNGEFTRLRDARVNKTRSNTSKRRGRRLHVATSSRSMETVLVVTLAHLWPGSGFDILVIDAEGAEAKILSMPLPQPLPRLVLFEIANLKASQLAAINSSLVAQGYEHVHDLHHQDAWAVAHGLPPQDRLYGIPLRFDRLSTVRGPPPPVSLPTVLDELVLVGKATLQPDGVQQKHSRNSSADGGTPVHPARRHRAVTRVSTQGFDILKSAGFEAANILDVGANVGAWTRAMKKSFPRAHFFMIDAEPYHFHDWQDLIDNRTVSGAAAVLDDRVRSVAWYRTRPRPGIGFKGWIDTGNSMFRERTRFGDESIEERRLTKTLDGVLAEHGQSDTTFDIIKLDVQGAELAAMRGGARTLSRASVVTMEMPFFGEFNRGAPTFGQYVHFMDVNGFTPFYISDQHTSRFSSGTVLIQIDLIFVRNTSSVSRQFQKVLGNFGGRRS